MLSRIMKKNAIKICVMILIMLSTSTGEREGYESLRDCQRDTCSLKQFNCDCEKGTLFSIFGIKPTCVPLSWVCDGWDDCDEGSDEIDCVCPSGFFQCGCDRGGGCSDTNDIYYCIREDKRCNGIIDCLSGRDELSCEGTNAHKCYSGEYIGHSQICDGKINCKDGYSDEVNCTSCPSESPNRCECNKVNNMTCRGNRFLLNFGNTCYSESERCNGLNDCPDNSDEANCTGCSLDRPHRCDCNQPGNNTCEKSFGCYSIWDHCDGMNDCSDNSDEANCHECPLDRPNRCDCNQPGNNTCKESSSCYSVWVIKKTFTISTSINSFLVKYRSVRCGVSTKPVNMSNSYLAFLAP